MGDLRRHLRQMHTRGGFSLLEVLIALVLVGVAMTALVLAFVSSGQFGVLTRRQATAMAIARSLASQIARTPYSAAVFTNTNTGNDATFADPNGLFAAPTPPTGANAPDSTWGDVTIDLSPWTTGDPREKFTAYVNVAPQNDPTNATVVQGVQFAVIVVYRVGTKWMRAVATGYRYNPGTIGVGQIPL